MRIICIIIFLMISVISVDKPDFGKMKEQKKEDISQIKNITLNKIKRYSEIYKNYE